MTRVLVLLTYASANLNPSSPWSVSCSLLTFLNSRKPTT